jgi:6-pyruvoyl-tetrahydropterin synthase
MFKVTKTLGVYYGHRLLKSAGKYCHLHGHNGRIEADIAPAALDSRGMVVDFTDIKNSLKQWVDETLDHRLLLAEGDPLVPVLLEACAPGWPVTTRSPSAPISSSTASVSIVRCYSAYTCAQTTGQGTHETSLGHHSHTERRPVHHNRRTGSEAACTARW